MKCEDPGHAEPPTPFFGQMRSSPVSASKVSQAGVDPSVSSLNNHPSDSKTFIQDTPELSGSGAASDPSHMRPIKKATGTKNAQKWGPSISQPSTSTVSGDGPDPSSEHSCKEANEAKDNSTMTSQFGQAWTYSKTSVAGMHDPITETSSTSTANGVRSHPVNEPDPRPFRHPGLLPYEDDSPDVKELWTQEWARWQSSEKKATAAAQVARDPRLLPYEEEMDEEEEL